jgi:hypothetical protein
MGWVISGAVKESMSSFYVPGGTSKSQINFMLRNSGSWTAFGQLGSTNKNRVFVQDSDLSMNRQSHLEADFTQDGISQGRGLTYWEEFTLAFTSTAVAGSEQLAFTTAAAITFADGRAYRVKIYASVKSAAAQGPGYNVRKTNLAGTQLFGGRVPIPLNGLDLNVVREGIVVNTSGAPVSAKLAITMTPQLATAVSLDGAPGKFEVVDIGAAAAAPTAGAYTGTSV